MKPYSSGRWLVTFGLLLAAAMPLRAQGIESGAAATTPWSGWWWPAQSGMLVLGYRGEPGPLVKHDQVTGKHAVAWEETQPFHFDPHNGQDWWGHCHAWAAASVLEPEPRHDVTMDGTTFHVGDVKGLLSEAHYVDQGIFYGQRFNGNPGDDFEDIYPLVLWYVLRKYVHDNQLPVIADLNPGPEVWSYPIYQYSLSYWPIDAGSYRSMAADALPLEKRTGPGPLPDGTGYYQGELGLWVAIFLVAPDDVGTQTQQRDYSFVFAARGSQPISGTDHWTGASVQDHPDFVWYPTARAQENPELAYNRVSQLDQQAR